MSVKDFAETLVEAMETALSKPDRMTEYYTARAAVVRAIRNGSVAVVRDEYAKESMALYFGALAKRVDTVTPKEYDDAARKCFRDADAMIAARVL